MPDISRSMILIMATNGFEQSELMEPLRQLKQAGATVHVAAPEKGSIKGWKDKAWGDSVDVDHMIADVKASEYDALVLPGGQMNPDVLRLDTGAIALIREFYHAGKVIAAICHAPWLLIDADIVDGRHVTSWPSLRIDLENAGADWSDEAVVTDQGIITSRKPGDLDQFIAKIIDEIGEGAHDRTSADAIAAPTG